LPQFCDLGFQDFIPGDAEIKLKVAALGGTHFPICKTKAADGRAASSCRDVTSSS
jgi:hypothetical protein